MNRQERRLARLTRRVMAQNGKLSAERWAVSVRYAQELVEMVLDTQPDIRVMFESAAVDWESIIRLILENLDAIIEFIEAIIGLFGAAPCTT